MRKRKWIFYPVLASAGFVLPVALMDVATAEPSEDASGSASEAATAAPSAAESAADVAEDTAQSATDAAMDAAQSAADAASDAADAASEAAESAADVAQDAVGERPATPDVSAAPAPSAAADAPGERMREYVVKEGDTLGDIARVHLGSVAAWPRIAELNGIEDPAELAVGTRLELPQD